MDLDWVDPQQGWLDPNEDWETSDEVWPVAGHPDIGWPEFDEVWDAYEQEYSDFDEGYERPELAWLDSSREWDEPGQRVYAPVYGVRMGLGFVMTCALLVGVVLSLVLYNATAGATILLLSEASQEAEQLSGTGNGYDEDRAEDGQQAADQADLSDVVCAVSDLYPPSILQWCELITHNANKHGLPPDLIAALIWQESGGNPTAYSRSGAVGLMQVMPRDGLAANFMCKNGPCFSTRPTTEELKDPEFNVAYGTRMLAGLLRRSGSLREALYSYGPMDMGYYYADKVLGIFQRYGKSQ